MNTLNKLDWVDVKSSVINSIAYADGDLYTQLNTGHAYRYLNVPESVYEALLNADSVGRVFNIQVKNNFEMEKI